MTSGGGGKDRDRRATERLELLAETTHAFAAATADYPTLLETIAERSTRLIGDGCVIAERSEDEQTATLATVTAENPVVTAGARVALMTGPVEVARLGIVFSVMRTGEPLLVPDVDTEVLAAAVAPSYADIVQRVGVRGFLSVPLQAGGRIVGGLALFRYRTDRPPYDETDLAFARSIADHAALAIANARLLDSLRRELRERRRAEEEAKTFVALVQNSTDFIGMASFDGRVLFLNDAGRRLVGLDPQRDVRELTLGDFHTETGMSRAEAILQKGSWEGEGVLRHFKTGELIPTRVSSFVARDANGAPLCFATIQSDLRATNALEARLRQSQKLEAIGRLAGGVAHDFNNILSVILSYSGLVAEALPEGSPQRVEVGEIERAGQRAASLTRQLLALGRKEIVDVKVLDLDAIVAGLRGMLARLVGEAVDLRTSPSGALHLIEADPGQIEQIVVNLVVNANDAMPSGGLLTIATSNVEIGPDAHSEDLAPGRYVLLSVSDTGVGIPEDALPRIFEPFFTTKSVGKGTGLGLPTVLGIVKQYGGHVAVASEPSQGTTFRVYLPRSHAATAGPEPPRPSGVRDLVRGGAETILLLEDEEQVRTLVGNVLRRAGYTVLEASDPQAAFDAAAHAESIALLVTDSVLRKTTGHRVAERLGGSRPGLKVLYLSGGASSPAEGVGDRERGARALRKPITPIGLLRAVRDLLDAAG